MDHGKGGQINGWLHGRIAVKLGWLMDVVWAVVSCSDFDLRSILSVPLMACHLSMAHLSFALTNDEWGFLLRLSDHVVWNSSFILMRSSSSWWKLQVPVDLVAVNSAVSWSEGTFFRGLIIHFSIVLTIAFLYALSRWVLQTAEKPVRMLPWINNIINQHYHRKNV